MLHGVRDPGDDTPGERAPGREPLPGLPRLPGTGGSEGGGAARDLGRREPVRDHLGREVAARRHRRQVRAPVRRERRPGARDHRHLWFHRGDDRGLARIPRSGRRGRGLRAVLRELRAGRDPLRRHATLRAAASARLVLRPGRAGGGLHAEDARDHRQHAQQPDRQGLHARAAADHRRLVLEARCGRRDRRDLRAHPLRGRRARGDGLVAGDEGPHDHDQRHEQELQRNRLAGGLDDCARGADRGDPQGPRLSHRRCPGPAAGGRGSRPGSARGVLRGAGRGLCEAPRAARHDARGCGLPRSPAPGGLLRDGRDRWPRLGRRRGVRAPSHAGDRRGRGPGLVVLSGPEGRSLPGALRVLQEGSDLAEAERRLARLRPRRRGGA